MEKLAASHPNNLLPDFGKGELALWAGAATIVLATHLAGAWYLQNTQASEAPALDAAPAIMMELAPIVTAPDAVPADITEMLDSTPTEQDTPSPIEEDAVEEQVEEEPAEAIPQEPEPEPEAEPEPVEEIEEVIEEHNEVELPDVAMTVPQRRPSPEKPRPAEKPPQKKKIEKKAPPPQVSATRSAQASPQAAAPRPAKPAAGSSVSPARWQSRVNAHLNRYKRYPRGARGIGTVTVSFTINPGGEVANISLARSSGDPIFDEAAMELVRRASPVPAPPPEIAQSRMRLSVPIRFSR